MRNAVKILIVDDDKASAQMLSEIVKRLGFKPVVALKPVDALNVVRLQTVHAALVDVLLPKMTGVELVGEFRKTKFADSPVIFVSGVFKDKAFAAETIKKTGAIDFLFKPFAIDELTDILKKSLQTLLTAERWSVHSLLTRKLNSDRERAKAIENLEQINGLDFPFVLSILMEVGSSGHLNIVNDTGEIFGVTLIKGTISEVDSSESQSTSVLALISKGFLSQEDWEEFQRSGGKKFSLERLVSEGYVSPHAISAARKEQILYDFRSICSAQTLQVNFVAQDEGEEAPKHAVKPNDLLEFLKSSLDEFFPASYLQEFYAPVKGSPIRLVADQAAIEPVWMSDAFKDLDKLKHELQIGGTLEHAILANPEIHSKIYQCLHYLVLNRAIMFDDVNRAKNLNSMLERYKKLYEELKDKTPDKIFEYFGASASSSANVFKTIYEEYSKSNHPDQLGKDATPELKDLCKKCFELVDKAKDVMLDETAKTNLMGQIKARAAEAQVQAQKLMNGALEMLRKGQSREAFETLKKAEALHKTARISYISAWAEIKAGAHANKARLQVLQKQLERTTTEERKSSFYFMAMGLIKKHLGDSASASFFEKALQTDPDFAEARRELHALQGMPKSGDTKKLDIFNGDITEIVSNIFRRKVD